MGDGSTGTGSGLGTRVLNILEEEFPEVCRIVTSVYPSAEDDVITSPYNSVLAMRELTEHADCVLPVENQVCFSQRAREGDVGGVGSSSPGRKGNPVQCQACIWRSDPP